jgi:opacity protein-like surface antigen
MLRSENGARGWIARALVPVFAMALLLPAELVAGTGQYQAGLVAGRADSDAMDDADYRFNMFFGYSWTERLNLGLRWDHTSAILHQDLDSLLLSGSFNLRPGRRAVPYLLAGIGRARSERSSLLGDTETRDSFAYQIGVGGCFYPGDARRLGVRVELSDLREDTFETNRSHRTLLAGISWTFGSGRGF